MGLFRSAGIKWAAIAVLVLAVGLSTYYVIQWYQQAVEDKITIEIQEQTNEKRKTIKDAIRVAPSADPNDASDSLQYLRDRQSD